MTEIEVHSLASAKCVWSRFRSVISIEDPDQVDILRIPDKDRQCVLTFHDAGWDAGLGPKKGHVAAAIRFARASQGNLLVHCHAGISRSTAIALAILADQFGSGKESEACKVAASWKFADPCETIIAHADKVLERGGTLIEAWEAFRPTTVAVKPEEVFR